MRELLTDIPTVFQFTHPGRGATSAGEQAKQAGSFQFTHPGRGATYLGRTGDDIAKFQFTHPGRGATYSSLLLRCIVVVSIHAPREGCDRCV